MDALYACSQKFSMLEIPEFYRDLLSSAGAATLGVLSKEDSIQSTMVWPDYDGQFIKLNIVSGSPKEASIKRNGKATILACDSSNENHYLSVRCELHNITYDGAIEHLNTITQRNMGVAQWYGGVEPSDCESKNKRVLVYLKPVRIYHT